MLQEGHRRRKMNLFDSNNNENDDKLLQWKVKKQFLFVEFRLCTCTHHITYTVHSFELNQIELKKTRRKNCIWNEKHKSDPEHK